MNKSITKRYKLNKIVAAIALLSVNHATFAAEAADDMALKQDSNLEVITVSAQKRIQNLQEVPISVTAFSGDQMAEAVIKDMYDLQANVPGLGAFQSQSATNSSFSIRGVGTSSQNFGLESSVGLYVDGVYRARQNSLINNLIDVEAVEVLRGPQGTLFGKNTPSGAILVKTVAPSHDGEDAFVELTAGNLGLVNYSGAASISAIEDVLAFRLTAFGSQRDGIISDVNLGDDVINDRNRWGARLQALYTPSDDVSVRIIADYSKIDEICCGAPVQMSNFEANDIPGKYGSDAAIPALGGTAFPGGDSFYDREIAVSFLPESSMTDRGLSLELNWDIDSNYAFTTVSAYRNFDSFDDIDTDFTDANLFGTSNDSRQSSFSQEIRLSYTGEDLNYIVGAYYFSQELDLDYSLYTDTLFNPFFMSQFQGAFDPLLDGINAISALTGGAVAPTAEAAPSGTGFDHTAEQQHESYALFGQFDYKFTDKLTLTAGLRYTDESKDLSTKFYENMAGGLEFPNFFSSVGDPTAPTPGTLIYGAGVAGAMLGAVGAGQMSPFDPAFLAAIEPFQTTGWGYSALGATTAGRADIAETLSDDQITGTIKLSYQQDNDTMMYASFGTGYKSGGTNTDRIKEGFNPLFDAETSQSFEVGIKKDFIEQNLRLNAAAHHTTVKDFQANTFTGNGFNLQNAGDYKITGLELEASWYPTDTLEVSLAYARVNAEYESFERGNCWVAYTWHTGIVDPGQESTDPANPNPYCNRTGDRPSGEPQDTATLSLKKEFNLSDSIYSYLQIDYSYTGDMVLDGSNDPYAMQDAYSVVNARYFINMTDYDVDVILWARNMLDEEYINRTNFNAPLQTGKLNAYVTEPATFGLTVKKRF